MARYGSIKIGMNEKCPCGSGKKFKKCCLGKEHESGTTGIPAAEKGKVSTDSIREFLKRDKIAMILDKISDDTQAIIGGLSEEEKNCLMVVAGAGGMVKYSKLNGFSDDMPYWWTNHGVNSTIGKLRAKGLLYVGKTMRGGRFYKMALMPRELVPKILTGQVSAG